MAVSKKTEKGNGDSGLYDRIVKYTGVFGGVQGLVTLVTLIRTKLVARLLGTVGFGINESFNRSLNFIRSTTDLGIPFSAVRTVSANFENENDSLVSESILVTRSWALLTAICGAVLCLVLSPLFSLWAFDGDKGYTLSFILLSPSVAFSAVTGGEMAILKGLRRLREIAVSQLYSVVFTLCISVPLFYYMGLRGLVPSLVLVSFASMAVTCRFSFKAVPYRVGWFRRDVMRQGTEMIRLGIFFTIASFFGSGTFSVIANYLMQAGGAEIVGAYSAGYALINYLGMFVFSAMESDFFPRLSSQSGDVESVNANVCRQAEVTLLLVTPMIAAFIVLLEPIVRVLLTDKFYSAIPMAQIAVLSLFFKAVTQPMAYISLAKGDSRTFLLQEVLYDLFLTGAVMLCFRWGGLRMIGLAITLACIFDFVVVGLIVRARYGMRLSRQTVGVMLKLPWPILLIFLSVTLLHGWTEITVCAAALAASVYLSYIELRRRTSFVKVLKEKLNRKFGL